MPADIDPDADPLTPARCPRRLLGEGPRCRALVLAGDAHEHDDFHDRLDELLAEPIVQAGQLEVAEWPAKPPLTEPAGPYAPDVR